MSERTEQNKSVMRYLPTSTCEEAGSYSPLALAFLGDSVFELHVRTCLMNAGNARPNELNRRKNRYVKAEAQAKMMDVLEDELNPTELSIYRRGRNAKSYTMAKNATMADYRRATGFEALMGYLYLSGQQARLLELIDRGIAHLDTTRGQKKVVQHYEAAPKREETADKEEQNG